MTRRETVLSLIRTAGYHGDRKALIRLYTENRIAYAVASKSYEEGRRMKEAGVPCGCSACRPVKPDSEF